MGADPRSPVVEFLAGTGRDGRGRLLPDILAFDDRALEAHHDYIQWLFPLDTPSAAVPGSPILSSQDIAEIRACGQCQANLRRALHRLTRFYEENDHWLVPTNHNHLRITRIIRSTRMLLSSSEAVEFFNAIMARVTTSGARVSPTSQRYWREALDQNAP